MGRVSVLALLWFALSTGAFAWEASKVDLSPRFSADGRTLVFERQDHGAGVSEVVLMDLRSGRARTVAGPLWTIGAGSRGTIVGVNELSASVIRTDGRVLSTVWGKGAGRPYVPMNAHLRFTGPRWQHGRLRFDTADAHHLAAWVRSWDFDPHTWKIRLLSRSPEGSPAATDRTHRVQGSGEAFAVDEYGRLYRCASGSARLVRLNSAAAAEFSPDGAYLVVKANDPQEPELAGIYLLRADGSGLRRLARGYASRFMWHPNGRWIAYTTWEGDLVRVNRDGSGRKVLGTNVPEGAQIRWSYHGERVLIAHHSGRTVAWRVLYPSSLRGKQVTRPVRVPGGGHVSLSPDGRLAVWMWVHPRRPEGELRVFGRDGRSRLRMAHICMEAVNSLTAGWSGDSRRLAVSIHGSVRLVDTRTWRYRVLTGELY